MPWKETAVMEQRIEFVARALGGNESVSGLCKEFDISRPTGYLWLNRYDECRSFTGLNERSRRPKRSPTRVSSECRQRVVELRKAHGWGRKKIPNAYELRQGLEDRGAKVEMIVYKSFPRGITKPKAMRAVMQHNLAWFNHYLWGDPLPDLANPELPKKEGKEKEGKEEEKKPVGN